MTSGVKYLTNFLSFTIFSTMFTIFVVLFIVTVPHFAWHQSSENLFIHQDNIFQLMIVIILLAGFIDKRWTLKGEPVVNHCILSVAFVQLYECYILNNHFWKKGARSINHWSPLLSICNSLNVITFTAFSVGELGNKLIKAWPSSMDCVKLGSSGMEPEEKEKIILWRSESNRQLEDTILLKLTNLRMVPTQYKGFCAKLGPRGKSRYL